MKILKQEGPLAFLNGLESTLWRHALWNGGYFGVIPTGVHTCLHCGRKGHSSPLSRAKACVVSETEKMYYKLRV